MQKPVGTVLVMLALLIGIQGDPACLAQKSGPPPEGSTFPNIQIPSPSNVEAQKYLGLDGGATFEISDVRAELVIVEVFSMYCPHCQREAPSVNELYRIIDSRPDLKGKVKILGIGAGNSAFEVDLFRKKYNIPFPLIPDPEYRMHSTLGEVRTPYFIVVKLGSNKQGRVIYSEAGSPGDPGKFLESLLKRATGK